MRQTPRTDRPDNSRIYGYMFIYIFAFASRALYRLSDLLHIFDSVSYQSSTRIALERSDVDVVFPPVVFYLACYWCKSSAARRTCSAHSNRFRCQKILWIECNPFEYKKNTYINTTQITLTGLKSGFFFALSIARINVTNNFDRKHRSGYILYYSITIMLLILSRQKAFFNAVTLISL